MRKRAKEEDEDEEEEEEKEKEEEEESIRHHFICLEATFFQVETLRN